MSAILLPVARKEQFLAADELASLRSYVIANADRFESAAVRRDGRERIEEEQRIAAVLGDLGNLKPWLSSRFAAALPDLMAQTGLAGTPPDDLELQLAAHGDGAFYACHIDNSLGPWRAARHKEPDRILSAVYYFHFEPKGFSGGELRIYGLDRGTEVSADPTFIDIEPVQNSLVAFHSWAPHEVRPVRCPSRQFRDFRFAINCWYRRDRNSSRDDARGAAP